MPHSRYRSLYEIARGGMGRVELVVDQRMHFERLHARKRLHDNFVDDTNIRAMFLDEARIAGFIRHPHVVSVTDVGEDEDGPFIVMDFVDGVSFSAMINSLAAAQVSLPLSVALSLLAQAAEGLHAAHEATDSSGRRLGVVHRDVSPQNILVGFDGHARVADFGIAKAVGGSSTRTETGVLKGKLGYSSPEVLRYEPADVLSDLFSFGVVLYEAVSMRRLYASNNGGPRAILNEPVPDLGDVVEDAPDELVELVFSLLAKDPAHRPRSAGEVAVRLRGILRDLPFDDVMSVSDFLEEHFDEERTSQRRRIEDARSRVRRMIDAFPADDSGSSELPTNPEHGGHGLDSFDSLDSLDSLKTSKLPSQSHAAVSETAETLAAPGPPRRRIPLWVMVPFAFVLTFGGVYVWLTQDTPAPEEQATGRVPTPSMSRVIVPESAPETSMRAADIASGMGPANSEQSGQSGQPGQSGEADQDSASDEDERPSMSRSRRRRRGMETMQVQESNVPIWDDY